jgi:hypothetical protein
MPPFAIFCSLTPPLKKAPDRMGTHQTLKIPGERKATGSCGEKVVDPFTNSKGSTTGAASGRDGRRRDDRRDHDGNRDRDSCPSDGRALPARALRPSSLRSIVARHDVEKPDERPRKVAGSNSARAICSDVPRDTNSPRPKRSPAPDAPEARPPLGAPAAHQSECRPRFAHELPTRPTRAIAPEKLPT